MLQFGIQKGNFFGNCYVQSIEALVFRFQRQHSHTAAIEKTVFILLKNSIIKAIIIKMTKEKYKGQNTARTLLSMFLRSPDDFNKACSVINSEWKKAVYIEALKDVSDAIKKSKLLYRRVSSYSPSIKKPSLGYLILDI